MIFFYIKRLIKFNIKVYWKFGVAELNEEKAVINMAKQRLFNWLCFEIIRIKEFDDQNFIIAIAYINKSIQISKSQ